MNQRLPNSFSEIYRSSRKSLVLIGMAHVVLVLGTLWLIVELNLRLGQGLSLSNNKMIMVNASLLGFLGSLLYFSRKVYVYLITDKFRRLMQEKEGRGNNDNNVDKFRTQIIGYYIYLSTRPVAGLIIGPLLLMFVLAGLTTFSRASTECEVGVSTAGIYSIYVVSFIGGYSSSDLFDYFSNLGGRLISKLDMK